MIDISKAFTAAGLSAYQLLVAPGMGFYIPLYQREYSWEADNVQQLIDDLSNGVDALYTQEKDEEEIRFLGTIITIEANKEKIKPQDPTALPGEIRLIIDGQQRITTLILFASQLYLIILQEETKIKKYAPFASVLEACSFWRGKLKSMFSLDLGWGTPPIKPKIIRGQEDWWIREGDISTAYNSPATKYISEFILFITEIESGANAFSLKNAPSFGKEIEGEEQMVSNSVWKIRAWLTDTVIKAHSDKKKDDFPSAQSMLVALKNEQFIWNYSRPDLKLLLEEGDTQNPKSGASHLSALVQLFAVAYYLLERCCFTVIQPTNEKWGLDMFQSLNATGTPLTAIETFKPAVVSTNTVIERKDFKDSEDAKWFKKIDDLFKGKKSASEKNRLTNDFLTSFALVTDATQPKLPSHFSAQRNWLDKLYSDLAKEGEVESPAKHAFIKFFGQYAEFYHHVRHDHELVAETALPLIKGRPEAELATVILLYLNKSNHRMSITILGQYYIIAQNASPQERDARVDDFIAAVKAVGAFYTLWRSAQTNSGIDAKYRNFFKGSGTKTEESKTFDNTTAWLQRTQEPTIAQLKQHLRESLVSNSSTDSKDPFSKEAWIRKAKVNLDYDSKQVAKFVLLLYAHDAIPDKDNRGLAKYGRPNVNDCMKVAIWNSPDTATLEHVAPQKGGGTWDSAIYQDDSFNQIGNLILLPGKFNSSAGNKDWDEKLLYYRHLGENDQDIVDKIAETAIAKGYILNPNTIKLMQQATHQAHIKVILDMDAARPWDAAFIAERTERIVTMTWDKLIKWLE